MKHFTKLLATTAAALSLSFTGAAQAQQQSLPTPVAAEKIPLSEVASKGPALWVVADDDTTIYLFGTVHALPKDVDWYNGPISEALDASDTVVFEIPTDKESGAKYQALMFEKGRLPEGTSLRSLLNDEQRATYETALGKLGMPVAAFDAFEPWLAGLALAMVPLMKEGYSPEQGVETRIGGFAGTGKKRDALETVEYQLGVFDGLDMDSQIKFLVETAESLDELKPTLDAMVKEWLEGDTEELGELMNASLTDPELAEALLYNRNANWTQWIDDRLDIPGTVFMAVGAGHLAGEQSVQDMLEDRQIAVTRIQ